MRSLTRIAASLAMLHAVAANGDEPHRLEDPVPPDARGLVLPISGPVYEIRFGSSAVAGKVEGLQGALRDLGAQVTEREIRIALAADVLFDFDKASLRAEAAPALGKVAEVLKAYPRASAKIEGHTDGKGDAAYNQKLSERRAETVRAWLAAHGASLSMSTRGLGKTRPVAPNTRPDGKDDPEGRQKNRRVEIAVKTR